MDKNTHLEVVVELSIYMEVQSIIPHYLDESFGKNRIFNPNSRAVRNNFFRKFQVFFQKKMFCAF